MQPKLSKIPRRSFHRERQCPQRRYTMYYILAATVALSIVAQLLAKYLQQH
ncbi:hypothetical protein KTO58_23460 [Chitinophaga pendula]|uniref:hypothetical protein n=1 Tax=Chitinophaga TaxID=79328 RepID=UPI0012FD5B86|nr:MULTISPECIES: hypothetical protein [Chitinophaga]UCJ06596.1 hypothetical protein KTO58_23460 [Chitinophaga pendula]